jgi:hypothetical protein
MCDEGARDQARRHRLDQPDPGPAAMNNTSVMQQTIGDQALTNQEGFKRILKVQRKYKIAVILTAHVRAEMDQTEIMRGNKVKMGASFGVQHYAEYFFLVDRIQSKEGQKDALGNTFENEALSAGVADRSERFAQKHRVTMKSNSAFGAAAGRTGEFTFDFRRGIVNQYEEVYDLAVQPRHHRAAEQPRARLR